MVMANYIRIMLLLTLGAPIPFVVLPAVLLRDEYYDECDTKVLVTCTCSACT